MLVAFTLGVLWPLATVQAERSAAVSIVNVTVVDVAAGTLVPLGLRAANVDPALASSVFITTMTDMFGFFSFLGLATVFARYLV